MSKLTCDELKQRQQAGEFTLLDVRLQGIKEAEPLSIAGAEWRNPEHIAEWQPLLPEEKPVVVFCAHGRSVSQGITTQLTEAGFEAYYLEGGLAAWIDNGNIVIY